MKRASLSETDLKSLDTNNNETDEWMRMDESDTPLFLESRIEIVSALATDAANLAAHHRVEFASVFLMMISPSIVMIVCIWVLRSLIAAMFAYHMVSCISGPVLYISLRFGTSQLPKICSQCMSKEMKMQLLFGFVYFAIIAIGGVCMYWAVGHTIVPNKLDVVEELGLSTDPLVREVYRVRVGCGDDHDAFSSSVSSASTSASSMLCSKKFSGESSSCEPWGYEK
eukprot:766227-Hanusia_phi.AAC.5